MGILTGTTVLDLSRVFAAPLATQMLGDLGATVWKIESLQGDDSRKWGDHVFNAFNRGKRSLALNLKDERAQRLLQRLARQADVLVENFKTGDLARYGLSYEALRSENPRLIYASLTGFGHTGPRRQQAGYDTVIQAMTGIMTATGEPDGPPTRVGVAWIDVMAGLVTTIGILAALQERAQSGAGQQIDLSLFDVGLMAMVDVAQDYLQNGRVQRRAGNVTRNISPAQVFATRDGWVVIAVGNDGQFARLCTLLGCPEITADPRFASNLARVAHRGALSDFLGPLIAAQERDDFVARLHGTNVPGSAILDIGETLRDAQAGARGAVWQVPSGAAALAMLASPLRHLSRTPAEPAGPPPALGEHSSAVLRDRLGLSEDDVAVLVRDGVVRTEA